MIDFVVGRATAMFSSALSAYRTKSWKMIATAPGTDPAGSCYVDTIPPDCATAGLVQPAITLASVVLPEPFKPTSATTSPWLISMLAAWRASALRPG